MAAVGTCRLKLGAFLVKCSSCSFCVGHNTLKCSLGACVCCARRQEPTWTPEGFLYIFPQVCVRIPARADPPDRRHKLMQAEGVVEASGKIKISRDACLARGCSVSSRDAFIARGRSVGSRVMRRCPGVFPRTQEYIALAHETCYLSQS